MNSLNFLFSECHNITEIDFSNFNSTLANEMHMMFYNCISLTSINFKNFDTSNVNDMQEMFKNCMNLTSLDLSSFNTSLLQNIYEMFSNCINLITLNLSNFNLSKTINTQNLFSGCNNLEILDLSNLIVSEETHIISISSNFHSLKYINFNNSCNFNINKCNILFENIPHDIIICSENLNDIIEKIDNLRDKCITNYCGNNFESILKNVSDGNNGCRLSCDNGYKKYYGKCYRNDTNIATSNIESIYSSTDIIETNIQTIRTNNIVTYLEKNSINTIKYLTDSTLNEKHTINIILNITDSLEAIKDDINITNLILEGEIASLLSNIDNENFMMEEYNKKYHISTLTNQNKQNSSFIELGDCEDLLKSEHNINPTEDLIIFKVENFFEGFNIPIIEYEIYSRNGTKLSLDICKNNSITYLIPVSINESEIFKYNPESNFYNNRCDKYTTENDTDLTLYDRKNEYNKNNFSLCEINCTFKDYNINTSKVECDCIVNTGINRLGINQTNLLNSMESIKSYINADVVKCAEIFTSTEDLKSNPGFYLLIFISVIYIIIFIFFWIKGYNSLKDKIEEVIYKTFKDQNNIKTNSIINTKENKITKKKGNNPRKNRNKKFNSDNSSFKEIKSSKLDNKTKKKITDILSTSKNVSDEKNKKFFETDYELNNASYEETRKFDKRSGCEYYFSLIKTKQIFIFTFLNFDDYNSGIIKKIIFFLLFALHYTINALFFNDANMHQIFEDQGNYNIKYQFKFIFLSAVLSTALLRIMLYTLVLTDKSIFEIKRQINLIHANILKKKTLKYIVVKFGIFFLLNLVLLVLFWYYLTCWNAVYQNTQIYLIKNTLISFAISLFYPFVINIIPFILRKQSLKKRKRECLYNASKIVQIL